MQLWNVWENAASWRRKSANPDEGRSRHAANTAAAVERAAQTGRAADRIGENIVRSAGVRVVACSLANKVSGAKTPLLS